MNAAGRASRKYAPKYASCTRLAWNVLISKMRLKPATMGVVRSAAIPHEVKQPITTISNNPIPG